MKLTWYGHSAFRVEAGGATILIDPFLTGNPSCRAGLGGRRPKGVTHVLLTHGHNDHFGDTMRDSARRPAPMLVANSEICRLPGRQGRCDDTINPGNHGGTVDCGGFTTTFVNAVHSSALTQEDGIRRLSRQSGRPRAAFPRRHDALPHGRHRHLSATWR